MKKHLNNPYISGILALLAIAFVYFSLDDSGSSFSYSSPLDDIYDEGEVYDESAEAFAAKSADVDGIHKLVTKSVSRNIFEPVVADAEETAQKAEDNIATASLFVKGVWIQGDIRYTVIDDKVFVPGQAYDRVQIDRIESSGVWINHARESHFIRPGEVWTYEYLKPKEAAPN